MDIPELLGTDSIGTISPERRDAEAFNSRHQTVVPRSGRIFGSLRNGSVSLFRSTVKQSKGLTR